MNKLRMLVLVGVFGFCSLMSGCLAVSAHESCVCLREREKFAQLVAKKVVAELQKQQESEEQTPNH